MMGNGQILRRNTDKDHEDLKLAVKSGNFDVIKSWIARGGCVRYFREGKDGFTLLHMAIEGRQLEVVKLLIEHGAKIDIKDYSGRSPLLWAVSCNHLEIVKILVNCGADINVKTSKKNQHVTPLLIAVDICSVEIVKCLLKNGANRNARDTEGRTSLFYATVRNNLEIVQLLIKEGADLNICCSEDNFSPLMIALGNGYNDISNVLLQNGANIGLYSGNNGATPLHFAVRKGSISIVRKLLLLGAKMMPNISNKQTPLHWAASDGSFEMCQILMKHGADVNAVDIRKVTPLFYAIATKENEEDQEAIIKTLISNGAKVDIKGTSFECTPLHIAIHCKKLRFFDILLKNGASLFRKDVSGRSALEFALDKKLADAVKVLLSSENL